MVFGLSRIWFGLSFFKLFWDDFYKRINQRMLVVVWKFQNELELARIKSFYALDSEYFWTKLGESCVDFSFDLFRGLVRN